MEIRRAAVIGAGVMGSGIAAHIANAGIPVDLLDIPAKTGPRDGIAAAAIERLLKTDPAPLMDRANARLIRPGNIEDDLDRLKEADWIVEAVVEKLEIKHGLYAKLAGIVKPDAILSSNTSTISLKRLTEGMPADLARRFAITHFFNPPRYLRLLEIVAPPGERSAAIRSLAEFADLRLGKAVVWAKDTPGFIANRIGAFWIQSAAVFAVDEGLTVEEADAVMGRPLGIPKTGIFGLLDLVGLDLQPHVDASLAAQLPKSDPYQALRRDWPLFDKMIAEGYTGRKGKGGFYRLVREGEEKRLEAIDLKTGSIPAEAGGAAGERRRRQGRAEGAGGKSRQGRALCLARALRPVELRRPGGAGDRRRHRRRRWRHAQWLQLEIRALPAHRPAGCQISGRAPGAREAARAAADRQGGRSRRLLSRARRRSGGARVRRRLSPDPAPAGRAAAGRYQARRQAAGRQWLGQPLGYRGWRRLP